MAVIKVGGGNTGIKEYFEKGRKQGRELTRDEIDQRIILEGDLDICDAIIQSRETEGERYDHISISFFEEDISPETLKAITADFKEFIGAAYGSDEMYLYAEAHMPKTATEKKWNSKEKEYETKKRYPHIHFILPKTNLVTGGYTSALEMIGLKYASKDKTMDIIDAFQETINKKYGLASPKDEEHRRTDFTSEADIISRIKEDVFTGRNLETLTIVRDSMIAQKIESPQAFRAMLEAMGEVTEGKGGEYLQLKLPGQKQNVRLTDYQFSAEFVSKPMQEKFDFYEKRANKKTPEQIKAVEANHERLLEKWKDRAREIKYLTPSSKFYLQYYVKATDEQKTHMLDRIEAAHFNELEKDFGYVNEKTNEAAIQRLAGPQVLDQSQVDALVKYMKVRESEQSAYLAHIEEFTSAKLNKTYLRTTEQLREAEEAGQQIIEEPGEVVTALTFNQSHFSEADLERHLLKNTDCPEQYHAAMKAVLASPELVVRSDDKHGMLFTSKTVVIIEKSLVERAERMAVAAVTPVTPAEQQAIIDAKPFNEGQREAFKLLCSEKQLAVVNGAAGTGKSFVLAAMREAYVKEGFTVYGAILQGKTAEDLERDSGIQSRTIAKMLLDLEKGKLKLDSKTVLVVDEAGMVGSRDLEKLMAYTEAAGARLRLVGDSKQLAAVEYGNAFVEVSARAEVASLTEIMRQKTEWQRQASEKFATHDIQGLQDYADRGHVHLDDTDQDAQIALVRDWSIHRIMKPEQTRIVLAHTNAARIELNALMRAELKKQGHLTNEIDVTTGRGKIAMAVGEIVMFTKADRDLGVKNGTTGTVSKISADGIVTVTLESGRTTEFAAQQEADKGTHIDFGYAVTVHKSQGMTLDAAFVLADKNMTKENLGVAMTRHRHEANIYASAEQFSDISTMVKALDKTGQKAFTVGREWTSEHRQEDSVIGQYVADLNTEKAIQRAAKTAQYKEIAANLEPKRILDYLSKSHGIDPGKYAIVTDEAGKQSIQVGQKTMNVATFLTKVVHLDYTKEAAPILKQCYAEQLAKAYSQPRLKPGQVIDQAIQREYAAHVEDRDAQYKKDNLAIGSRKRDAVAEINKSEATAPEKASARALLNTEIQAARKGLEAEHGKHTAEIYKDFLAAKAPQSARHLDELARVSFTPADQTRLAAIQIAQGIVPGLSHLTPQQIQKGVSNVLNRTQDQGRPPAHILARNAAARAARLADDFTRSEEHTAEPAAKGSSGLHELPAGRVDGAGQDSGMLLPDTLHGGLGNQQTRKNQDVRRAGTSAIGSERDASTNAINADAGGTTANRATEHDSRAIRRDDPIVRAASERERASEERQRSQLPVVQPIEQIPFVPEYEYDDPGQSWHGEEYDFEALAAVAPALPPSNKTAQRGIEPAVAEPTQEQQEIDDKAKLPETPPAPIAPDDDFDYDPGQEYSGDEHDAKAEAAEAQKIADAEKAAEEHRLSEPVQRADIQRQIDAAKAAADPRSMLVHSKTIDADLDEPAHGVIVGSNEQFVAVQCGEVVKRYRTLELTKNLTYDGTDTGPGRFAPGNELTRKNSKDGMRTLLTEEREAMQTEVRRARARDKGLGI